MEIQARMGTRLQKMPGSIVTVQDGHAWGAAGMLGTLLERVAMRNGGIAYGYAMLPCWPSHYVDMVAELPKAASPDG